MALGDILVTLVAHRVDFVVVGGMAAVLQGVPVQTLDIDIVYARDEANVGRLLTALHELDAVFRTDARGLRPDLGHLRSAGHKLLRTRHGVLDALGTIEDATGYDDLIADAVRLEVVGVTVDVVSLDRLIRIKEKLTRPKDRAMLILLRATLDELRRSG
jgi:hypothetical protein